MKYLAVFIWHGDDGATWSTEVDTLDKRTVVNELLNKGQQNSLDDAEVLVIESVATAKRKGQQVISMALTTPKVIHHWSAANGDFEGM